MADPPTSQRRHAPPWPGLTGASPSRRQLTEVLVARRTALGMSQTEVAAKMGTSQSAVARLESGSVDVRLSTLDRYAAALGQRLGWALEGDEGAPG